MFLHKGGKIKNWGGERCHTYKIAVSKYQGRSEQRSEVFVKTFFFFWGGGEGGGSGWGGRGWGGHRVDVNKVFVKIKKKKNWLGRVGGGGGVRVDVNEELKFF